MTNKQDELLPCPFCGSEAHHYPDGDMEGYSIMCDSYGKGCPMNTFGYATAEEAEKAWNTRPTPSDEVNDSELMEDEILRPRLCSEEAQMAFAAQFQSSDEVKRLEYVGEVMFEGDKITNLQNAIGIEDNKRYFLYAALSHKEEAE